MPLRDILCLACGHEFEEIVKHGDPLPACPHCESTRVEAPITAHGGIIGSFGTVPKRNQGSYKRGSK